jgi:hypothetical protein
MSVLFGTPPGRRCAAACRLFVTGSRVSRHVGSLIVTGIEVHVEFGNSLESSFSQGTAFAGDVDFSDAPDLWHATLERRNQFV